MQTEEFYLQIVQITAKQDLTGLLSKDANK